MIGGNHIEILGREILRDGSVTVQASLSLADARRIAIAAQGLGGGRPSGGIGIRRLAGQVERLGLVQIDSVNVLARAHYLPLHARLGAYDPGLLDAAATDARHLFEYWGHEASLIPVAMQPLFRWRMARAAQGIGIWRGVATFGRERQDFIRAVRDRIAAEGPMTAGAFDQGRRGAGGWWGWGEAKQALEWLFWAGEITTRRRQGGFERLYDLTERVLPAEVMEVATPDVADAHRALADIAARALGIATVSDIADYFRLATAETRPAIADLVEAGRLLPVEVEGWRQPAFLHVEAPAPKGCRSDALLAPFDPLVWERDRAERLFGFRYRIEIYVPAEKRVHGYYVLPFLMGEHLAARVDLKADRKAGALLVRGAHVEPGHPRGKVAARLAPRLQVMAGWRGLARVEVEPPGDLAPALSGALLATAGDQAYSAVSTRG